MRTRAFQLVRSKRSLRPVCRAASSNAHAFRRACLPCVRVPRPHRQTTPSVIRPETRGSGRAGRGGDPSTPGGGRDPPGRCGLYAARPDGRRRVADRWCRGKPDRRRDTRMVDQQPGRKPGWRDRRVEILVAGFFPSALQRRVGKDRRLDALGEVGRKVPAQREPRAHRFPILGKPPPAKASQVCNCGSEAQFGTSRMVRLTFGQSSPFRYAQLECPLASRGS